MKLVCIGLNIGLLLAGSCQCYSQSFMNLNFESASLSGYSGGYTLPTASAFPDWSAYLGSPSNPTQANQSTVFYDTISTGGAIVALVDSSALNGLAPLPIQGNYSAFLEGSIRAADTTASLGQTGTIPGTAQSIVFWESTGGSLDVSFNGQALSLVDVSNAVNYTVYAANISSFAGETGQLLFTAPVQAEAVLDNIQFSTSSVPEPGVLALSALGGVLFGWRRWRKKSSG
ncbi:MAG TPA: PEP-CTERM sorting domain-containing protein [Verrucomicrobiae bacterium]|nr:PEP-CTERM sorting domain-containing protein [Verrucomicrobiae bacterium]